MPARVNVRPYAYLDYPIDELSLGEAPNKHGVSIELCAYVYGEAEIAYDCDGDWEIVALRIDGTRPNYGAVRNQLKDSAELAHDHPLYPVILAALHGLSWQDIGDRVADALAKEREMV